MSEEKSAVPRRIVGNPSWTMQAAAGEKALLTVSYGAAIQTILLPRADVSILFDTLAQFLNWKPIVKGSRHARLNA